MPFLDSSQPTGLLFTCNLIHGLVRDEFSGGTWGRGKVRGSKGLPRHRVWHRPSGSLLFVPAVHTHTAWKTEMESFFVRRSKDVSQWIAVAVFLTAAPGCCSTSAALKLLTASAPQWHFLSRSSSSVELALKYTCANRVVHKGKISGIRWKGKIVHSRID